MQRGARRFFDVVASPCEGPHLIRWLVLALLSFLLLLLSVLSACRLAYSLLVSIPQRSCVRAVQRPGDPQAQPLYRF